MNTFALWRKFVRPAACTGALALCFALTLACAHGPKPRVLTTEVAVNALTDEGEARSRVEVLQQAQLEGRKALMAQVLNLQTADGRRLDACVVSDPFALAKVRDEVCAAQIADRRFDDAGNVTLTMRLNLTALEAWLKTY